MKLRHFATETEHRFSCHRNLCASDVTTFYRNENALLVEKLRAQEKTHGTQSGVRHVQSSYRYDNQWVERFEMNCGETRLRNVPRELLALCLSGMYTHCLKIPRETCNSCKTCVMIFFVVTRTAGKHLKLFMTGWIEQLTAIIVHNEPRVKQTSWHLTSNTWQSRGRNVWRHFLGSRNVPKGRGKTQKYGGRKGRPSWSSVYFQKNKHFPPPIT